MTIYTYRLWCICKYRTFCLQTKQIVSSSFILICCFVLSHTCPCLSLHIIGVNSCDHEKTNIGLVDTVLHIWMDGPLHMVALLEFVTIIGWEKEWSHCEQILTSWGLFNTFWEQSQMCMTSSNDYTLNNKDNCTFFNIEMGMLITVLRWLCPLKSKLAKMPPRNCNIFC